MLTNDTAWTQPTRTEDPSSSSPLVSAESSDREILLCGRRAFDRGEDATAFENLSRLVEHGIPYADVHYMLGILLERKGERRKAIKSLRRATRSNPSYVEALLALASLHEAEGDFDLSASYAERASQLTRSISGRLDPTTRGKLSNQQADLADALLEAGERRDAIAQYRQALDRCPNFHDIRHRLGIALRESGLPFQAAQEFNRILSVHAGMLESQIQLGVTYYSLGRTPEAKQQWEAVLERDPSRDEARMYLRLVNGDAGDPERASRPVHPPATSQRPDSSDSPSSLSSPSGSPSPSSSPSPHGSPSPHDSPSPHGSPSPSPSPSGWSTRVIEASGGEPSHLPREGAKSGVEGLSVASLEPHDGPNFVEIQGDAER